MTLILLRLLKKRMTDFLDAVNMSENSALTQNTVLCHISMSTVTMGHPFLKNFLYLGA